MFAEEHMQLIRCQQAHPIEPIRLNKIQTTKTKPKKNILTPNYVASTIITVISATIFATYFVIMAFLVYYAPTSFDKGLIINVFVVGLVVLYLLSRCPFYLRLGISFFILLTILIAEHYIQEIPIWSVILTCTIILLSFGYGQFNLIREKEKIWHKYIQENNSFSHSIHKGILRIIGHVPNSVISKKYFAEENTSELLRRIKDNQLFYTFTNRIIPRTDDYIDNILIAGKNLIMTRSITLPEEITEERQSYNINAYHEDYAEDLIKEFSQEFPKYNISVYYIVYSENKDYNISYTSNNNRIHFIKPQEISEIHTSLIQGKKALLTRRDDVLKLATMSYSNKATINKKDYITFTRRLG